MGKNNWPDFDAIIQKAVNAGRAQGMSIAKDAYKATERRLYALPVLRQKVEDDKEKLEQIKTHGAPERSKSIVRFSRTGYRLTPEEMLEAIIKDLEATIAADEYEIETLEKALAHIEDDPPSRPSTSTGSRTTTSPLTSNAATRSSGSSVEGWCGPSRFSSTARRRQCEFQPRICEPCV